MRELSQIQDRYRGALLGGAIGDALGAPFEGVQPTAWLDLHRAQHEDLPFARYTDDTHMTLGLADSLIACGGFDGAHLARTWARNYEAQPWRGYGAGPPEVFRLLLQGLPWDAAGAQLFGGVGSYGNGAAMRVAPVALLAYRDLARAADLARQQARITHTHPLGVEGAALQAAAVACLVDSDPEQLFDRQAFLGTLSQTISEPTYQRRLALLYRLGAEATPEEVVERLGNGIAAHEAVPAALACFLHAPRSFVATLGFALRLGGDTDTIAAMAGTLSGAYLGAAALPARWISQVEDAARIAGCAEQLMMLSLHSYAGTIRAKALAR